MSPMQGSFRGVRPSKFRHLMGIASKPDRCYQTSDHRTLHQATDASSTVDVNPKFLALVVEVAGGGAFVVVPLEKAGRVPSSSPRVVGHRGPVTALKWCPHNDNLIASASDDASVRLWHIPDTGLRESASEAQCVLEGHSRRVTLLLWHPTADGVLFSAGLDKMVYIWDVSAGLCLQSLSCHQDAICSMSLNRNGSLLATTAKDKKLRIIDPRTQAVLQETVCHEGAKSCQAVYLGDSCRVATVGFGRHSERQLAVWDDTNLSVPLRRDTVDTASGVLVPFYDHDTRLLFVAGKGDGNIRFYEMTDEAPYCHYLNQYISGDPQRGLAVLCKRGCRVLECEVVRFYKLHATRPLCQPISMVVPRKSGQFQQDLFPDTAAPTPAMTAAHWMAGLNMPPLTMPLITGVNVKTHRPVPVRPCDVIADKNADKKFHFLTNQTRADYRPMQGEGEVSCSSSEKDLKTCSNLDTKFQSLQKMWGQQKPDNDESALRSPPPQQQQQETLCQPPKPQHSLQYQQEQLNKQQHQQQQMMLINSSNINQQLQQDQLNKNNLINANNNSAVLAAIRKYELPPQGAGETPTSTTSLTEKMMAEIMMEKPSVQSEAELRLAYISQCAELKLLRRQLLAKERQVRELQLLLDQTNLPQHLQQKSQKPRR